MYALWAHVAGSWAAAQACGNAGIVVIEHDGSRYETPTFVHVSDTGLNVATLETGG